MSTVEVHGSVLEALLARGGPPDAAVIDGVRALSELFTVGRDRLGVDYLSTSSLRRAYLLYFAPVNLAKALSVLAEIPALPARPLRILDLGSGAGVGALALRQSFSSEGEGRAGTEVLTVDRNRAVLDDAEAVWKTLSATLPLSQVRLQPVHLDLERPGPHAPWTQQTFDLIILINSLNELYRSARDPIARRTRLLTQLLASLAPDGTLVVIEPALRETSRGLHEVRDRVMSLRSANVYSPCLHDLPCPALVHRGDWCHEERSWRPPAIVEEIDRTVGFIKDALKFSYVVLRKDGRTIVDRTPGDFRVVSERLMMKGEQRVWLCNEAGRQLVGRLNKERSDLNAAFDQYQRGAIVRLTDIDRRTSVGRVRKTAKAELIRPGP